MWLNRAGLFMDSLPESLKCFGTNLMDLAKVVKSSFGNDVQEGWRGHIKDFKQSYKTLKMTWTPSLHGIVSHVEDWYDLMGTERGLGWYSEQATEHAHTACRCLGQQEIQEAFQSSRLWLSAQGWHGHLQQ